MVVKYGTNNPILSAPQLANVTTATDFDNSDNPFYLVHLSSFFPLHNHRI